MVDVWLRMIDWSKPEVVWTDTTGLGMKWNEGGGMNLQTHEALELFARHEVHTESPSPPKPVSHDVATGLLKLSELMYGGGRDVSHVTEICPEASSAFTPEEIREIWDSLKGIDFDAFQELHAYYFPNADSDEDYFEFDYFKEYCMQWLRAIEDAASRGMGLARNVA